MPSSPSLSSRAHAVWQWINDPNRRQGMSQPLLEDPELRAKVKERLDPRHYEHMEGKEDQVYWVPFSGQANDPSQWVAGVNTMDYERHEKMKIGSQPARGKAKYIYQDDDLVETISHEIRHDAPEISLNEDRNRLEDIIHSGKKLNSTEAVQQWAEWMSARDDTYYSMYIPEEAEAIARDYGKAIGKFMPIHETLNFEHEFRKKHGSVTR